MKYMMVQFEDTVDLSGYPSGATVTVSSEGVSPAPGTVFAKAEVVNPPADTHTHHVVGVANLTPAQVVGETTAPISP